MTEQQSIKHSREMDEGRSIQVVERSRAMSYEMTKTQGTKAKRHSVINQR